METSDFKIFETPRLSPEPSRDMKADFDALSTGTAYPFSGKWPHLDHAQADPEDEELTLLKNLS